MQLEPLDRIAVNAEMKRTIVDDAAGTVGRWHLSADVSFLSGPAPLPALQSVSKDLDPDIVLKGSIKATII